MAGTAKKAVAKKATPKKRTVTRQSVKRGRKLVKREFTIAQHTDPRRHEPGGQGIYLDDVLREKAEVQRAKLEGRKPDFDNMGSTAGDVVMPTKHAASVLTPGSVVNPDYELEVAETDNN